MMDEIELVCRRCMTESGEAWIRVGEMSYEDAKFLGRVAEEMQKGRHPTAIVFGEEVR